MSDETDPIPDNDTDVPDGTHDLSAAGAQTAPTGPGVTGLPAVDAAVQQLSGLTERPVEEHVAVYDDVQRRLHDALAELDDEQ